ncbi:amino acid adenylation domain-containing protein [Pendulispora rubella]|uniref:Amino acid adenylation domain-containing protein n=1 Tax=Pendulispora rubella TaxID=2741070 RepID=A0ABZ2KW89_9BACT|nr:SrbD [Sorangiineae bacterium]
MAPVAIVRELKTLGVELWTDAGQLRFRAPKGVLTEDRLALLRAHKAEILDVLAAEQPPRVSADLHARHEPFPLTDVQTAYLLGRQDSFGFGGVACHGYLELHYPHVEPERLTGAWNQLIARHDMLRAVVEADGYQHVLPEVPRYRIQVEDLREASPDRTDRALTAIRAAMDHRMHATAVWPLFELRQTRTREGDIVHFSMDALLADWASAEILFAELDQILDGAGDDLPPLQIQFRDYLLAERRLRDTARYQRDREHWLARVPHLPPAPELPFVSISNSGEVRFQRHRRRVEMPHWEHLRRRAGEHGITPSVAVLAAYVAVLQRWARRPSFSVNLTILHRLPLHSDVERLVGDFTSVSLLAVEPSAGRRFREHAARLGEQLFEDMDHRLFSGVEVLREVARQRGREAAISPVVFTSAIGLARKRAARFGYGITQTPQVTLDCQVQDDANGLQIHWDVRQGVYPDGLVEDMLEAMHGLLLRLAEDADAWEALDPVALPAWQSAERARVNRTGGPVPDSQLHRAAVERASTSPDAVAVIDPRGALTYRELMLRAGAVAAALREGGCVPGECVAIAMQKGVEQVIAVLGVLLAGAVYLPVDTTQPRLRRDKLLANAGVVHVLTQSWVAALPAAESLPEVAWADPDALAYVIYTSGSTGDPKGVMISHRAALNTLEDIQRRFPMTAADRVLGLAQLGFDLSVYDVFATLAAGAALVLPDPERLADPSHWAALVAQHGVTVWNSVPAQMQMLASYLPTEPVNVASLRLALLSGDWIPVSLPEQIRRFIPHLRMIGLGGATEASIWSNYHCIEKVDPTWRSIPYGVPLTNQAFRVLDGALRDAPVWAAGDLYIAGLGLASGYLGDPQLTSERFFAHPVDGQRLYRTGDMARYLPGGIVEFLGREDSQIKLRGHRIELGEIEAALLAHPAVGAAAACVVESEHEGRSLSAFVEARRSSVDRDELSARHARLRSAAVRFADRPDLEPMHVPAYLSALRDASLASMLAVLPHDHTVEEMFSAVRVAERHHWLVRRWLGMLTESGWLSFDASSGRYRHQRAVDADTVRGAWQRVHEFASETGLCTPAFVQYHLAHVERLHALLEDRQSPFELLFPEGRQEIALALYRDDAIARYNNHAVAALINRIAASTPGGSKLRVLEVGAGTGATSGVVLPLLEGYDVDYVFTDQTAFFLADAGRRFGEYPYLRTGLFDLDQDYRAQGYAPNSADVVLCAGMLNSTRNVEAAVASAIALLAPGGWLVFTEPTADHAHILLTQGFMMDPEDGDREHGTSKFRSTSAWRALIERNGGELAFCLPAEEHPFAAYGMHAFAAQFKSDRQSIRLDELGPFLAERIPAHMIPSHLQIVDALPLTANGKVDRKKLAGLRPASLEGSPADGPHDAEVDELDGRLCALWAHALGIAKLGRDDNFYQRGADSLILARVAGRLREEIPEAASLAYDTLLRQMLNEPTVQALGRMLRRGEEAKKTTPCDAEHGIPRHREGSNSLLVSFGGGEGGGGGARPVRVMFHAALGTMDYFQHLGHALAAQNLGPVVGVAVADAEQYLETAPRELIDRLADDYAQRLVDEGFEEFQLIGYCLGGLLAIEVARRLLERGLSVRDLTLVDSIPMFIETDEELAFEAIFVPNLQLDPVAAVFGPEVEAADVYRAIEKLMVDYDRNVPAGAMAKLSGDAGLEAVAAAVRRQSARPQEERLAAYAHAAASQAGVPIGPELVPSLFRVCRHSMRAARFDPPPYVGDMNYLRCMEQQSFGITAGVGHLAAPFWEQTCLGQFRVIDVPGNHFSVIEPPLVEHVAEHLAGSLRGAPQ